MAFLSVASRWFARLGGVFIQDALNKQLAQAILRQSLSEVQRALSMGADANRAVCPSERAEPPLALAAAMNWPAGVRELLSAGAYPNALGPYRSSALARALEEAPEGGLEVIKALLAGGANPNEGCPPGESSLLHMAVGRGWHGHARAFLENGARVEAKAARSQGESDGAPLSESPAIRTAIWGEDEAMVELLLGHGGSREMAVEVAREFNLNDLAGRLLAKGERQALQTETAGERRPSRRVSRSL